MEPKPCRFWVARGHQIKLSLTIGLNKKECFFSKRWRVPKNLSKVQVSPEVAALNARDLGGKIGAFLGHQLDDFDDHQGEGS